MIADELKYRIRTAFGYEPTQEQQAAIDVFATFMADSRMMPVMVRALQSLEQQLVLMAPTGRAAKVFSLYAGSAAYTIHRRIYRQKSLEGGFDLGYNNAKDTLFIVDEASMISLNGEGRSLLDDLISFVYNGSNCRLMLIGDQAQLPPVGEACTSMSVRSTRCCVRVRRVAFCGMRQRSGASPPTPLQVERGVSTSLLLFPRYCLTGLRTSMSSLATN